MAPPNETLLASVARKLSSAHESNADGLVLRWDSPPGDARLCGPVSCSLCFGLARSAGSLAAALLPAGARLPAASTGLSGYVELSDCSLEGPTHMVVVGPARRKGNRSA